MPSLVHRALAAFAFVIPAQAGIHGVAAVALPGAWTPACAGVAGWSAAAQRGRMPSLVHRALAGFAFVIPAQAGIHGVAAAALPGGVDTRLRGCGGVVRSVGAKVSGAGPPQA